MGMFLARPCPVCDRPAAEIFCTDCQHQLQECNTRTASWPNWRLPEALTESLPEPMPVAALGRYDGTLKRAILALKYGDRPDVAEPLGYQLAQQWLCHAAVPRARRLRPYVLPIPLHPSRQATRGYNQAELIARAFCQASGLSLLPRGLLRVQATLPQHQLGLQARQENLQQAFQVGKTLLRLRRGVPALMVDDIYTTGSTARSAATTLEAEGIPVLGILVAAKAAL